jgi:hypothetical protein
MKLAKTVLVRLLALVIGPPMETDMEALLGLRFKVQLPESKVVVRGTVVRVFQVPGRSDVVQIVLDDPESHYALVPARMATKEYRDWYNECKRISDERKRIYDEPNEPILDTDIVPVLIGAGLLAFETAFIIIFGLS